MKMAKTWSFEQTKRGYANLWAKIEIKPGADAVNADRFAKKIIANLDRYRAVERATGVPGFFIGGLHMRESGCSFDGVLHNGERIIGTGRKTRLVPAGRGPFASWEAAAIDALQLKGLHKITDWTVARMGYEAERFNGLGYVGKGVNSAYVWAGSNLEQSGKYVADHVWDKGFDDPQIGVMTVLKRLAELRSDIAARLTVPAESVAAFTPVEAEMAAANLAKPMVQSEIAQAASIGGGGLTIAGVTSSAWDGLKEAPESLLNTIVAMAQKPAFLIAAATAGVCLFIWWKRKRMQIMPASPPSVAGG